MNFCFWIEDGVARYVPVASRVQLSTGRPVPQAVPRMVERRPMTDAEREAMEVRMAAVDKEMAEKHHVESEPKRTARFADNSPVADKDNGDDDGEDDFGDEDSSSEEEVFGRAARTIVAAES